MEVLPNLQSQTVIAAALEQLADYITDLEARSVVELWLYNNNVTFTPNMTLSSFSESNMGGYTRFNVLSGGFTTPAPDPQWRAYTSTQLAVFTYTGGQTDTIYGSALVATNPNGVQAVGTATLTSTAVSALAFSNDGSGYAVAPKVTFSGGGGSGAAATVTISNGAIGGYSIITGGTGYTAAPTVHIDPPLELIVANQLSQSGIPMSTVGQNVLCTGQIVVPAAAS
jgi:hypothetical protein